MPVKITASRFFYYLKKTVIMDKKFSRVELLTGPSAMQRIRDARVIIFGTGGVGSWAVESLVRSGIGHLTLVDYDDIDVTNINRQLPATTVTVGKVKTDVMKRRMLEINPDAEIETRHEFYTAETADSFDLDSYDYVIDASDSMADKALLILNATRSHSRLFSSMGAALKMDPTQVSVAEFWKVEGCPLAASLRRRFKKEGVFPARKFKCVYSPELYKNAESPSSIIDETGKRVNGTVAHTTAIFGFTLAGLVIEDICNRS